LVIFLIIYLVSLIDSYIELLILVFFFLVIPPFVLFFIKFYVILSLDFIMKLGFFLVIFDVFVLLYYFSIRGQKTTVVITSTPTLEEAKTRTRKWE